MNQNQLDTNFLLDDSSAVQLAVLSSYGIAIMTLITFIFAMFAVPISGAFAPEGGIGYPYLDTLKQFPRDYIWQYLAQLMICIYLINIIAVKAIVKKEKQVYMQIACAFAIVATVTLLINYFVQVHVVPVSLMNNEHDGIALLTQYNPHGLFIALEELGYIMMTVSFGFLIPVFRAKSTNAISVIYFIAVAIAVISFIIISALFGLEKKDRYEVAIICTTWFVLIINGILTGNKVRKLWKDNK